MEKDWVLYTEAFAHHVLGWSEGELARRSAAFIRECVTPAMLRAYVDAIPQFDAADLLGDVNAPTLVLHRRGVTFTSMKLVRDLAASIPNAKLVVFEGDSPLPFVGEIEPVATAIDDFLAEGEPSPQTPELPSGTAVILFADIADSTGLTERLGDTAFRAKARELDAALRGAIRENGGTPVEGKLLGDGVLAVFTSAREGIAAAVACGERGSQADLPLHLGLHAGDVIREEGNVYGGAVNIAARISQLATPGEILVSDTLRGVARTSASVRFEDRGERELRGVSESVRVWAVVEA